MNDAAETIRRRLALSGGVLGVAFRPFVWRRATRLGGERRRWADSLEVLEVISAHIAEELLSESRALLRSRPS